MVGYSKKPRRSPIRKKSVFKSPDQTSREESPAPSKQELPQIRGTHVFPKEHYELDSLPESLSKKTRTRGRQIEELSDVRAEDDEELDDQYLFGKYMLKKVDSAYLNVDALPSERLGAHRGSGAGGAFVRPSTNNSLVVPQEEFASAKGGSARIGQRSLSHAQIKSTDMLP